MGEGTSVIVLCYSQGQSETFTAPDGQTCTSDVWDFVVTSDQDRGGMWLTSSSTLVAIPPNSSGRKAHAVPFSSIWQTPKTDTTAWLVSSKALGGG